MAPDVTNTQGRLSYRLSAKTECPYAVRLQMAFIYYADLAQGV